MSRPSAVRRSVSAPSQRAGSLLSAVAILSLTVASIAVAQGPSAKIAPPSDAVVAIVGVTVIDGNGGPARPDETIIVRGKRIVEIGPRASVKVPEGARVVDGTGKFATPGFTDT